LDDIDNVCSDVHSTELSYRRPFTHP
jgi:hypothetical protein